MNDKEWDKWVAFKSEHKKAKRVYNTRFHDSGIGETVIAIAKYRFRKVEEDITDYDCW